MSVYTNYDQVCDSYDECRRPAGGNVIAGLISANTGSQLQDLHVLDLGCGTGNYAVDLLNNGLGRITLADASPGMLSKAKDKLEQAGVSDRVCELKVTVLPEIPFTDNFFDAVMINQVLHHLESSPNGRDFPTIQKTFNEVNRVLKPGGVLVITNTTPNQQRGLWFTNLLPEVLERFLPRMPSVEDVHTMMSNSNFHRTSTLSYIGSDWFQDYANIEGPLSEHWRRTDSYFSYATEDEIAEAVVFVKMMKEKGILRSFFEKHDGSQTLGAFTIFTGRK